MYGYHWEKIDVGHYRDLKGLTQFDGNSHCLNFDKGCETAPLIYSSNLNQ